MLFREGGMVCVCVCVCVCVFVALFLSHAKATSHLGAITMTTQWESGQLLAVAKFQYPRMHCDLLTSRKRSSKILWEPLSNTIRYFSDISKCRVIGGEISFTICCVQKAGGPFNSVNDRLESLKLSLGNLVHWKCGAHFECPVFYPLSYICIDSVAKANMFYPLSYGCMFLGCYTVPGCL